MKPKKASLQWKDRSVAFILLLPHPPLTRDVEIGHSNSPYSILHRNNLETK